MAFQEAFVSTYDQADFDRLVKRIVDTGEAYYNKFACIPLSLLTFEEDTEIFKKGDRAIYFAGESFILERDYSVIGYDRTVVSPNGVREEEDGNYRMLALRDDLLNRVIGVVFAADLPGAMEIVKKEPFRFTGYGNAPDTSKELKRASTYLNKRCNECNEALREYRAPVYKDVEEQYQSYFDAQGAALFVDGQMPGKDASEDEFFHSLRDDAFAQMLDYTYGAMLTHNPKWDAFLKTVEDKLEVEKRFFYEPFVSELKKNTAAFINMLWLNNRPKADNAGCERF